MMDSVRQKIDKIERKTSRCLSILKRDYPNIQASKDPTKYIFIGNAGLTTKADESSLTELITTVGCCVEAITLLPEKSYSFASFFKKEEAQVFVLYANGQRTIKGSSSPVYLAYVDKVPTISSVVRYDLPQGLQILEEFVSKPEEELLLNLIDWKDNPVSNGEGRALKHRQVRHFGYEFKYGSNTVDKHNPLPQRIPEAVLPILKRILEAGIMPDLPDQLTINHYLPGQGIPPHIDTHSSFTDEILSLSLGGGIKMEFQHIGDAADDAQNPDQCAVYLKPRSLCVMTGPARYEWSHGICPRKTDVMPSQESGMGLQIHPREERTSFTFRKLRNGVCHCRNTNVCDARNYPKNVTPAEEKMTPSSNCEDASELERKHVLNVYDKIANHFSETRHKPWPQVLEFVSSLQPGSFLLDVGCGNGKYLGHNKQLIEVGCDTSFELLKICRNRGFEALNCNCLQLPYRSCVFDAAICIAVIHHLASEDRRIAAIEEIVRVLRFGGRGLIYVWAMEQKRGKNMSSYLKQNKTDRKKEEEVGSRENSIQNSNGLPVHTNRTEFMEQDMFVPWKLKPQQKIKSALCKSSGGTSDETIPVFHRFYHVFKQLELENLCKKIEGVNIVKSYYDEGNWCVIFEKTFT